MTSRISRIQHRLFSSTAPSRKTYGFIGLGHMGFPMARNLRDKIALDDTLYVYDVDTETMKRFMKMSEARDGPAVYAAGDSLETIINSEIILTVLPSCTSILQTIPPLLPSLPTHPPKLFLDCSTISLKTSHHIQTLFSPTPHTYLDTPMSGGVPGATTATLTFLLGTPPTSPILPLASSTLRHIGSKIIPCGPPTTGLAAKLSNNYLLAATNIATADAMTLGTSLGVPAALLASVISQSTGRCWPIEVNNPMRGVTPGAPVERDYEGGFSVGLMGKDLRLAREVARERGVRVLLGGAVRGGLWGDGGGGVGGEGLFGGL